MSERMERPYGQMPDDSVWHSMMLERAHELVGTRNPTAEQIAERTCVRSDEVRRMFRDERKGK